MGEFCDFTLEAMCGAADQTGTCEPIPEACATIYAPVCGCDGVTYGNACEANGAGIAVATQGECGGSAGVDCGGFAGLLCPNGELCDFTLEAMCGAADQMGTCKPIPDACDTMYVPVCGCDGVTYGNTCEANAAGVAIVATGACK